MSATWDDMIPERLKGRTRLVQRSQLKRGDIAVSSHYGERTVAWIRTRGIEGGTTQIIWEGGTEQHPLTESYPGLSKIPQVMPDAYVVTTHHARCSACNCYLDEALTAARLADEPISTYNSQDGHGATVERETYQQRRAALGEA